MENEVTKLLEIIKEHIRNIIQDNKMFSLEKETNNLMKHIASNNTSIILANRATEKQSLLSQTLNLHFKNQKFKFLNLLILKKILRKITYKNKSELITLGNGIWEFTERMQLICIFLI